MESIVIYGAGGFAREVAALIEDINRVEPTWELLGFLADDAGVPGSKLMGYPVLGGGDWLSGRTGVNAVLGIGSPVAKRRLYRRWEASGVRFPALRHPSAILSRTVELGAGSIVTAGCLLTVDMNIGQCVTINLGCTLGHDCIVEDFVTFAPGVNVSGNVSVGQGSDIGTGAAIIQGLSIGEWSIIGAGAVVAKSLPDNCTAVGVPAKVIKEREAGWHDA